MIYCRWRSSRCWIGRRRFEILESGLEGSQTRLPSNCIGRLHQTIIVMPPQAMLVVVDRGICAKRTDS